MSDNSPFYGNSGGGGGGGFMTSPYGSQGSPGGQRKVASHSLRPVTIKQIHEAQQAHSDAEWTIDGVEISNITIVGCVRNIGVQATNTAYSIEDGTGTIEARLWMDSTDESKRDEIPLNSHVRVLGTLKSFNNKRHISATRVRPVTQHMEVYFHLADVLNTHLQLTRGPPPPPGGAAARAPGGVSNGTASHSDYVMGNGAPTAADTSTSFDLSGMSPLERAIILFVDNDTSEEGPHVTTITRAVGKNHTVGEISAALDSLSDNGHVYQTIDDFHYKSAK